MPVVNGKQGHVGRIPVQLFAILINTYEYLFFSKRLFKIKPILMPVVNGKQGHVGRSNYLHLFISIYFPLFPLFKINCTIAVLVLFFFELILNSFYDIYDI